MKVLKNISLIITSLVLVIACQSKEVKIASNAVVKGQLAVNAIDEVYFYTDDLNNEYFDTLKVQNGKFEHQVQVGDEGNIAYLSLANVEYPLFLSKGDTLYINQKDSVSVTISGNKDHIVYDDLMKKYDSNPDSIYILVDYIKEHPFSLSSYYLFKSYLIDTNILSLSEVKDVVESLPGVLQDKYYMEVLLTRMSKAGRAAVGNTAPYFTLKNIKNNKSLDLQQIKDKFVVMSFWASWNDLSRNNNSVLNRINKKLAQNKDFKMVSIALQNDTLSLKSYLKKDKWNWDQLYDVSGFEATVSDRYGIVELPTYFVINKKTSIVFRTNSVDSLENIITKLYKEDKDKTKK